MRFLYLTTYYGSYLEKFYAARPGLESSPYGTQMAALLDDAYAWSDHWGRAIEPLGYESSVIIGNAAFLRRAWARENGARGLSAQELCLEQALQWKPDVVFMDDYSFFTADWLRELRSRCPSLGLVLSWCGAPFADMEAFKHADLLLTCIPGLVEKFRAAGIRCEHLHHAFSPRVLAKLPPRDPSIDVSFVGSLFRGAEYHSEREKLLESVVQRSPILIFSSELEKPRPGLKALARSGLAGLIGAARRCRLPVDAGFRAVGWGGTLARIEDSARPMHPVLKARMRPAVYGVDMYRVLRDSKATFNSHISLSARSASNMRLFESTGVGTCLVTDWKEDLASIFKPDEEVVSYRSAEEAVEKISWLLENPGKREAIARAGQERTLRDHTFTNRGLVLDAHIRKLYRKPGAAPSAAGRRP